MTRICSHHGTAGTLQHSTAGGFWCRDPHHGSKSLIPHVLRATRQRCPLLQHRFPHSAPAPGIPTRSRWSIPGGRIPQLRMPGCSSSAGQPTRSGSARRLPPKFLICSQINYYLITAPVVRCSFAPRGCRISPTRWGWGFVGRGVQTERGGPRWVTGPPPGEARGGGRGPTAPQRVNFYFQQRQHLPRGVGTVGRAGKGAAAGVPGSGGGVPGGGRSRAHGARREETSR